MISRTQFGSYCLLIYRGKPVNGRYSHSFTDVGGNWVDAELGWPVYAGVINGVGGNRFDPEGYLAVEQAIATTYRALTPLSGWNSWSGEDSFGAMRTS